VKENDGPKIFLTANSRSASGSFWKTLSHGGSEITDCHLRVFNHLTPNGHYMGRTAPLTSRCRILYIYSTNIRIEYFKHAA